MKRSFELGMLVVAATLCACGDGGSNAERFTSSSNSGGFKGRSGGVMGSGGDMTDGGLGGDSGAESGGVAVTGGNPGGGDGPMLTFVAPVPETSAQGAGVITGRTVRVQCQVKATDNPVDESSVKIILVDVDDPTRGSEGVIDKKPDDVFEAEFSLANRPNGPVQFLCEATDTAVEPNLTRITLDSLLDLGPQITVTFPADQQILYLKEPVRVEFLALPSPLAAGDEGAEVASVSLTVPGALSPITVTPEAEAGRYSASIDFDDRNLFDAPPSTAEITVSATNRRSAGPVTRTVKVGIQLDGRGPEVEIVNPEPSQIIHGEVLIRLKLTDPSGIAEDTIVGRIPNPDSGQPILLQDWTLTNGEYVHRFDSNVLLKTRAQASLNISVEDTVGNESSAALTMQLDNRPPLVSLDPPPIREFTVSANPSGTRCTLPFDPVGDAAADDLDVIPNGAALLRTIAWDQTNGVPGATALYALTDPSKVTLYSRRADGTPLLINTAGGGAGSTCDEVNFADLPVPQRPVEQQLSPLSPKGNAQTDVLDFDPDAAICNLPPNAVSAAPYCGERDMYRITTQHPIAANVAGVFALQPSNRANDPTECGLELHLFSDLGTGWVCVVARAEDYVGNVGVSPPLRLWVQQIVCDSTGNNCAPEPAYDGSPAPSCTDGCQPPAELPTGMLYQKR